MTTRGFLGTFLVLLVATAVVAGLARGQTVTTPFVANGLGTLTPGANGEFTVTAEGEATHLGRYTAAGVQVFQPGTPPTFVGHVTLTGANGDELDITVTGIVTSPPPVTAGEGQYEITGGTGRFDGASGQGSFSAAGDGTRFDGFIRFSPGS